MSRMDSLPPLPWHGGCQCGAVRYTLTRPPLTLYVCHCTECQQQSSSAFGMSMRIRRDGFEMTGQTSLFVRDPGKRTEAEAIFCSACGSRLIHKRPGAAEFYTLKAGSLDIRQMLEPVGHIWTASKQAWVQIDPQMLNFAGQPENGYDALIEAWNA